MTINRLPIRTKHLSTVLVTQAPTIMDTLRSVSHHPPAVPHTGSVLATHLEDLAMDSAASTFTAAAACPGVSAPAMDLATLVSAVPTVDMEVFPVDMAPQMVDTEGLSVDMVSLIQDSATPTEDLAEHMGHTESLLTGEAISLLF